MDYKPNTPAIMHSKMNATRLNSVVLKIYQFGQLSLGTIVIFSIALHVKFLEKEIDFGYRQRFNRQPKKAVKYAHQTVPNG